MDIDLNNAIGLLEECLVNGNISRDSLCAWFGGERHLIESTAQNLRELEAQHNQSLDSDSDGRAVLEGDVYNIEYVEGDKITLTRCP